MQKKAKKILATVISFGLIMAGTATALIWMQESRNVSSESAAPAVDLFKEPQQSLTRNDIEPLKAKIERLQSERSQLDRLIKEIAGELTSLRSQIAQAKADQKSLARNVEQTIRTAAEGAQASEMLEEANAPALTPEEEIERADAQVRAQMALVEEKILAEEIDLEWANSAQHALNETLQREEMQGLKLVSAECRTTVCRVELSLDGPISVEENFHRLVHFAPWQSQGFMQVNDEGLAIVYLAREGYSLPQTSE